METKANIAPVLVVGAGPSGLMIAHELKRFGIPVTIVDKEVTKSPYSRAIAVQIRTLEIFSALKLYDHLAQASNDVTGISIFAESENPLTIPIGGTGSFYERLLVVDQPHTEKVLEEALAAAGQEILRGVEFIDYVADAVGLRANLRLPNGEIKSERFSYLIGADGAHSVVRKKMANQFLGSTYDDAFILADVECHHPFDHHTFRIFFRKQNFLALIPMHGEHHYRLISVRRGETQKMGPTPTVEEFQNIAKTVVPFPIEIKNPRWVSRFFVQCRSASHYQDDRVFLVGDAAHIHSPAGGQGMNTGLQDAFNLAWKLALVLKGKARDSLLLTYHDERKPVGDFLIERTDRLFKFMVQSSLWARFLRRVMLPFFGRSKDLRSKLFTIGSQTAIRYEHGAICTEVAHQPWQKIRVGRRVPNIKLINCQLKKTDLHSLVIENGFSCWIFLPKDIDKKFAKTLLQKSIAQISVFAKNLTTFAVFANDYDAENAALDLAHFIALAPDDTFVSSEPFYILVRPDHHVFCVGHLNALDHGIQALQRFL